MKNKRSWEGFRYLDEIGCNFNCFLGFHGLQHSELCEVVLIYHDVPTFNIRTRLHINAVNLASRIELRRHNWLNHYSFLYSSLLLLTSFTTFNEVDHLLHCDVGIPLFQSLKCKQPTSKITQKGSKRFQKIEIKKAENKKGYKMKVINLYE